MLFSTVIVSALVFLQGSFAAPTVRAPNALTVQQVVDNIGTVTKVSGDLAKAIEPIGIRSTPQDVAAASKTAVTQFTVIINALSTFVPAMDATSPFNGAGGTAVVTVLKDFVTVHQNLLSVVIGKHGPLAQFGVTAPVAAVLRTLEGGIDAFAFSMINLIPTEKDMVNEGQGKLDRSVGESIEKYEEICVPAPLYPNVQPICVGL